jgi:hypothetical protein
MADPEDRRPSWEGIDLGQWSPDQSVRLEVAEELIGLLQGWSGERLRAEQSAAHPDPELIDRLRAQHEEYLKRGRELNGLDEAAVERIIEEYGPVAQHILGREWWTFLTAGTGR